MSFLDLRCFSNLLDGVDFAVKLSMAFLLTCKSKIWDNIAVDAFLKCYVYALCTICDVWFSFC